MDLFKAQLERIQKQLSSLTPSQKMLTVAMVAIVVMTLVWWGHYAGEPEMEPLLPQAISSDELPRVEMELDAKGIKHTMSGDRLLVPADRKVEAVASLMYAHALPRNAKDGFDEVLKNINPFMSQSQSDKVWNRGKELTVSQIISLFPDVSEAHVMIDPTREVRIGGGVDPSATVTITTRSGNKVPQQLVDAAADVVQGAQSSLPRNKIRVVVDGVPRRVRQDDAVAGGGMFADDQQESIQKSEMHFEEKIRNHFTDIPGLMVSVTVKLNTTRVMEDSETYDGKGAISKPIETYNKTNETTGGAGSGGEPGVAANTGLTVNPTAASASSGGPTSNQEENKEKLQLFVPKTETHRATPAGDSSAVAAAVRVPLGYFAALYTRDNPGVKDPTEAQMRPLIDQQLPKIRRDVMMCTALKSENDVAVETYFDPAPVQAAAQTPTAGVSIALFGGSHLKEIILGVLALISLFMVSMVVKKGTPAPAVASAPAASSAPGPTPALDAGNELAGEVGSGGTTLDGMELDDDAIRTQQMLEQVSSLVKENPDSAATLVKRWLNRA